MVLNRPLRLLISRRCKCPYGFETIHSVSCRFRQWLDRALSLRVRNRNCKKWRGVYFGRWRFPIMRGGCRATPLDHFHGCVILFLMRKFHDAKIELEHRVCWIND